MLNIEKIRENTRSIIQSLGYMNNMFAHIGSVSQCYALQKLEKNTMTILELSRALGLEHSSVSRMVSELVAKGYCQYTVNLDDKRSRYLLLTKKGEKKTNEIHKIANEQVNLALQQLTSEQKKIVLEGLQLYAEALNKSQNERTKK